MKSIVTFMSFTNNFMNEINNKKQCKEFTEETNEWTVYLCLYQRRSIDEVDCLCERQIPLVEQEWLILPEQVS